VLISADPETSHRAGEAVRIALGLVAGENDVQIALRGAAAKILGAAIEDCVDGEETVKHVTALKRLGQAFHVDHQAIPADGGWNPLGVRVVPLDPDALARLVAASRRVLVF
jgi:hypothetical protein